MGKDIRGAGMDANLIFVLKKYAEAIADIEKSVWIPLKDTLVEITNASGSKFKKYSAGRLSAEGSLHCYYEGRTSKTSTPTQTNYWRNWKPVPDELSALNWIENTGVMPDAEYVVVELNDGGIESGIPDNFSWLVASYDLSIKQYFIVRK